MWLFTFQNSEMSIYFDETSINSLGYNLLNAEKLSDAIEIFNDFVKVTQFPFCFSYFVVSNRSIKINVVFSTIKF